MAAVPPPQGLTEGDYEAIEAAVTETVRGRWFLSEFARRNRLAETRQLVAAMARIEAIVSAGPALPSADPSIRLLVQRIKEVAGQLGTVAGDLRAAGVDEDLVSAVEMQARAVAGMMRSATPVREVKADPLPKPEAAPAPLAAPPRMPRADLPPSLGGPPAIAATAQPTPALESVDPRLAALSGFDGLSLAKKLALFT